MRRSPPRPWISRVSRRTRRRVPTVQPSASGSPLPSAPAGDFAGVTVARSKVRLGRAPFPVADRRPLKRAPRSATKLLNNKVRPLSPPVKSRPHQSRPGTAWTAPADQSRNTMPPTASLAHGRCSSAVPEHRPAWPRELKRGGRTSRHKPGALSLPRRLVTSQESPSRA